MKVDTIDQDLLTFDELYAVMLNLNYCRALRNYQLHAEAVAGQNLNAKQYLDIEQAELLLNQIWLQLNPEQDSAHITKANLFDYLLLLMFHVG